MLRLGPICTALVAMVTFTGCYYDNEEALYPNKFCVVGEPTMAEYYAQSIQPIIQTRCATPGCHVPGGTGAGNFTTFSDLSSAVSDGKFSTQVFQQKTMPPSGALNSCEIQKLQAWVDAGAPN